MCPGFHVSCRNIRLFCRIEENKERVVVFFINERHLAGFAGTHYCQFWLGIQHFISFFRPDGYLGSGHKHDRIGCTHIFAFSRHSFCGHCNFGWSQSLRRHPVFRKRTYAFVWSALHQVRAVPDSFEFLGRSVEVIYPVLAWIGVMMTGYCSGALYRPEMNAGKRKKWLISISAGAIILFVFLRLFNVYGDPQPWISQSSGFFTFLSFMNVTKYPPSLLYILITLGPALLILAFAERRYTGFANSIIRIGRVPMFFYILHIYLLHLLALFAAKFTGFHWSDMVSVVPFTPTPEGYGFSLLIVYGFWILAILLLYPLCKWYDTYKTNNKQKLWLSYL